MNAITHRDYSIKGTDIQVKMFDNRIVVESPGKLSGLVKPDNIRNTHFSRNPKIAEFLKAYKYVKEYGEGVNRMYNEMKNAGLPGPTFYRNNFMLQTVIRNNKFLDSIVNELPFEEDKELVKRQKLPIDKEYLPFEGQKLPIGALKEYLENGEISFVMKKSITILYNAIKENQIFGRKEVEDILSCPYRTAGNIITVMKEAGIIEPIKGKGKGRYIFSIKK